MNLDWAAGFFDGEGTVGLWKNNKHRRLTVSVSQNSAKPLQLFCDLVGAGSVRGPYKSTNGDKYHYQWAASGEEAVEVFDALNGRLQVKQEQYTDAIREFREYQTTLTYRKPKS